MSRLRVVRPGEDGEPVEVSFAEAARAALERALAANPTALMILWEAEKYDWESVPDSCALQLGLLAEVTSLITPPKDEGD